MNFYIPTIRQRLKQAHEVNSKMRSELNRQHARIRQLDVDIVVANVKADRATARADALEKACDELRADLASWMDQREVSSDG